MGCQVFIIFELKTIEKKVSNQISNFNNNLSINSTQTNSSPITSITISRSTNSVLAAITSTSQMPTQPVTSKEITTTARTTNTSTTTTSMPITQTSFDPHNSFITNLNGHGNEVNLIVPLNYNLLATGSYDDSIIVWNTISRLQKNLILILKMEATKMLSHAYLLWITIMIDLLRLRLI